MLSLFLFPPLGQCPKRKLVCTSYTYRCSGVYAVGEESYLVLTAEVAKCDSGIGLERFDVDREYGLQRCSYA